MDGVLQRVDYWGTGILVVLFLYLLWFNRSALWRFACPERWWFGWIPLLLLVTIGGGLRFYAVPHDFNVFDDEVTHFDIARNMHGYQRFSIRISDLNVDPDEVLVPAPCAPDGTCPPGAIGRSPAGTDSLPRWMPVFHFLLSCVFHVFGVGLSAPFLLNAFLGTLAIVVYFGLGKVLFRRDESAVILSALLAFHPLHLKFSGGASLEPASVVLAGTTLLALGVFLQAKESGVALLAMAAACLAMMTRIENAILLALVVLVIVHRLYVEPAFRRRTVIVASVATTVLALGQFFVSFGRYSYWRDASDATYLRSLPEFLFTNPLSPLVLPILAASGLVLLWHRRRAWVLLGVGCGFLYVFAYTEVHKVDLNRLDFQRFNLGYAPFLLGLAAGTLHRLIEIRRHWASVTAGACLLLYGVGVVDAVHEIGAPYWPAYNEEVEWIRSVGQRLEREVIVCSETSVNVRTNANLRTTVPSVTLALPENSDFDLVYYRPLAPKRDPATDWEAELTKRYRLIPLEVTRIGGNPVGFFDMRPR